jgi:hypothetical protein
LFVEGSERPENVEQRRGLTNTRGRRLDRRLRSSSDSSILKFAKERVVLLTGVSTHLG